MKNWVFDGEDNTFVKVDTGERVGLDDFRLFQSEQHTILRGKKGEERLDLCLEAKRPAKEALDAPLVIPNLNEPMSVVAAAGIALAQADDDGMARNDSCMVCGHEIHVGTCQIV